MSETIYISTTGVRFGGGKFDSAKSYIRAGTAGASFPMAYGVTIDLIAPGWWRYNLSTYTLDAAPYQPSALAGYQGDFAADFETVRLV